MDLTRGTTHDYVDNPYWSIFQIKVKQMAQKEPFKLMDRDLGKVSWLISHRCVGRAHSELNPRRLTERRNRSPARRLVASTQQVPGA